MPASPHIPEGEKEKKRRFRTGSQVPHESCSLHFDFLTGSLSTGDAICPADLHAFFLGS